MIIAINLIASLLVAPACTAAEYHQFDFWVGDWTVAAPNGKVVGTNTIDRPLGSCVLQEHWLDGASADGKMTLSGPGVNQSGAAIINRITWQRVDGDPNRVRQLWETSADGGKTWQTSFDGLYTRKKAK